jgi:hypothetical protein
MGYDAAKLLLLSQNIAGPKQWVYVDTGGETAAAYQAVGYFTDAKNRGVDTGDFIKIVAKGVNETYDGIFTTVQDTGATSGSVKVTDTD